MRRLAWLGGACVAALFAACSATSSSPHHGSGGSGGSAGTGNGTGGAGNASGSGGRPPGDAATLDVNSGGAGGTPVGEVYGHSNATLYKLEPYSKTISIVGNFDCLGNFVALGGGMWDIAIDKDGHMVGSINNGVPGALNAGAIVTIDKATAHCSVVRTGSYPNSLTYVPAGTLLPNSEALVGYNRDVYVQISTQNATVTTIGDLNPNPTGQNWESSGDIVSIIGDKTYLTVKPYGATTGTDSIVEVDPKTGQIIKMIGNTGFAKLWGLGYWAGVAYGFSATGQLAQINLTTGVGTAIPLKNIPAGLSFWGAGVTTAAPIKPPQ